MIPRRYDVVNGVADCIRSRPPTTKVLLSFEMLGHESLVTSLAKKLGVRFYFPPVRPSGSKYTFAFTNQQLHCERYLELQLLAESDPGLRDAVTFKRNGSRFALCGGFRVKDPRIQDELFIQVGEY